MNDKEKEELKAVCRKFAQIADPTSALGAFLLLANEEGAFTETTRVGPTAPAVIAPPAP